MVECEGSEGESTPEYEGSDIDDKDGLIGDEMGLSVTEWAYRRRNGLIGDRMGISATEWAYWQRFLFWFGFGTVANSYQRRLPEPSRMVIGDGLGSYRRRCGKLSVTVNGDLLGFYQRW